MIEKRIDESISTEQRLELEHAEALMKGIIIPPQPDILIEVLNEQRKPDVNLKRIAELISRDVAISAGTLRIVNSAFYGLRKKIKSIDHAVRLIGVKNVTNLVTALMLHSAFGNVRGPFMEQYWAGSIQLAMAAASIARLYPDIEEEEAYAIGLFADCGVPLMMRRFKDYPQVYQEAHETTDVTVTSYEDAAFKTDHSLVGYLVGRSWKLPDVFCQAILYHHDCRNNIADQQIITEGDAAYLAVIQTAFHIKRMIEGLPVSFEWQQKGEIIKSFLGISEDDITKATRMVSNARSLEA